MNPSLEHPEKEVAPSVFEEAESIIHGDRERTYGDPSKNLSRIAELWNSYLQERLRETLALAMDYRYGSELSQEELRKITKRVNIGITITQVCRMMQLLKMARDENEPKRDNIVDDMGYAGLVHRCRTPQPAKVSASQPVNEQEQLWAMVRDKALDVAVERKAPRKRGRSSSKLGKRSKR